MIRWSICVCTLGSFEEIVSSNRKQRRENSEQRPVEMFVTQKSKQVETIGRKKNQPGLGFFRS